MRLLGCVLVFGAFTWGGVRAGWELKRRSTVLNCLLYALEQMEREIKWSLKPLPELLDGIGKRSEGVLGDFFSACAQHARRPTPSFSVGWQKELKKLEKELSEEAYRCMENLGNGLGRYDEMGEQSLFASTTEELHRCLDQSRQLCENRCRLYGMLGITLGAFLVIILV